MARTGGGARNPANQPRAVQVSRKVSWLLRHGAGSEGLQLGKGGYVNVGLALQTRALRGLGVSFEELRGVVRENEKQRFSMVRVGEEGKEGGEEEGGEGKGKGEGEGEEEANDPFNYLIRANQGHSIKIDTEGLLTPITVAANNIPNSVIHGTDDRAWPLILQSGGLRRMTRNHIHFASGLPRGFGPLTTTSTTSTSPPATSKETEDKETEDKEHPAPVISGMRTSSTILIHINTPAALAAGIPFFVSQNGVILSAGNEEGVLPYSFFERVERRKTGGAGWEVVMRDGELPEGVCVDVSAWEREVGGKRGGRGGGKAKAKVKAKAKAKARVNDDARDVLAGVHG
ncbi:hypothetical protein EKO04_010988 [Ascochyta lentis]|uniref:2'-phosphotransferase n=1 Tax=Ascochyta lentis TaxID=205686 RepID=A0A8H7IWN8_9PLEO|nr:hypothetical protein EKO04_010988 [Ascochyta lentis]